jgi:hypothetical protein
MSMVADVSSCEGLRTPAPVCAAPPSWGRHPQTFTNPEVEDAMIQTTRLTEKPPECCSSIQP